MHVEAFRDLFSITENTRQSDHGRRARGRLVRKQSNPRPMTKTPKMAGRGERGVFAVVLTQGVYYDQFLAGPSILQDSSRTTGTAALGRGECAGIRVNLA